MCLTRFSSVAYPRLMSSSPACVHLLQAAVAFNLGAVQSQLALQCDRKTEAGLKESAKLFQVWVAVVLDL